MEQPRPRVASVLGGSQGPGREASERVLKVRLPFVKVQ